MKKKKTVHRHNIIIVGHRNILSYWNNYNVGVGAETRYYARALTRPRSPRALVSAVHAQQYYHNIIIYVIIIIKQVVRGVYSGGTAIRPVIRPWPGPQLRPGRHRLTRRSGYALL